MPAPEPHEDPDRSDPLEPLLDRWEQAAPPQPRSVTPEVWQRIAAAEREHVRPVPGWLERFHAAFARPSFAATFVVACMLLGLFLAEVRSSRWQAEQGARLVQNYLRLIDPLLGETAPRLAPKP
jgi:hypothetical protein